MTRLFTLVCLIQFVWATPVVYAQFANGNHKTDCEANFDGRSCWGLQMDLAKEKHALFSDSYDAKNYSEALEPLIWLMKNTPNLNKSLYIQGEKVLVALEKNEADKILKKEYQDQLLHLYDQRIKYFGEDKKVKQKKGLKLYPFLSKRSQEEQKVLFEFYQELLSSCGHETFRSNVIYFMRSLQKQHAIEEVSVEDAIQHYTKAMSIIDHRLEKGNTDQLSKWTKAQEITERIFTKIVGDRIDCVFIQEHWGKQVETAPNNTKHLKKVIRFMISQKCTDSPLFLKTVEALTKQEPSLKLYRILIRKYTSSENYNKLEEVLNKKIELTQSSSNDKEQADAYMKLGRLKIKQGKKVKAREYLLKAAELDPELAPKAYSALGDLYIQSRIDCFAKGKDAAKDRFFYYAAYEMYRKAGNNKGMQNAANQFPTISDIFQYGYEEGQSIQIDCWIGGSYKIKRRP